MNSEVIVTCSVTGGSEPAAHRPRTPKEIAGSAIDAAKAGAAIVHIHVRDPQSGAASRRVDLYREVVDRIRSSGVDVVLNLTTGMGMDMILEDKDPTRAGPGSDIVPALERMPHVEELLPEICSFDCGTYTFGEQMVSICTLEMARVLARRMQELGVRPEMEIFDMGNIEQSKILLAEGLLDEPLYYQLCLGIIGNAPATPESMMALRDMLPPGVALVGVRRLALRDADGRPGGAAGRQRARRPGGQPLAGKGRAGDQRPARGEGRRHHRKPRRARGDACGRPRAPQAARHAVT